MKKHKWKKLIAIITTVISSLYGVNIYMDLNDGIPEEQVQTIVNSSDILLRFGEIYFMEDGYKIQIDIDEFGRKRVIFTPGGNDDR